MARGTAISWADNSANFWWGCLKVSPGCSNCYAEVIDKHQHWGPAATTTRSRMKNVWSSIESWNRRAGHTGERERTFVMSMGDFFEDHPQVTPWRNKAIPLLEACTNLDILMLTKRPENVANMAPGWLQRWPAHVWMGISVEDQQRLDERLPVLRTIPAAVRWLSCEPLLGPLDLGDLDGIHWVVIGGESGPKYRPMELSWLLSIVDQCQRADVPVFVKQDNAKHEGGQGRIPDAIWTIKQFPVTLQDAPAEQMILFA